MYHYAWCMYLPRLYTFIHVSAQHISSLSFEMFWAHTIVVWAEHKLGRHGFRLRMSRQMNSRTWALQCMILPSSYIFSSLFGQMSKVDVVSSITLEEIVELARCANSGKMWNSWLTKKDWQQAPDFGQCTYHCFHPVFDPTSYIWICRSQCLWDLVRSRASPRPFEIDEHVRKGSK